MGTPRRYVGPHDREGVGLPLPVEVPGAARQVAELREIEPSKPEPPTRLVMAENTGYRTPPIRVQLVKEPVKRPYSKFTVGVDAVLFLGGFADFVYSYITNGNLFTGPLVMVLFAGLIIRSLKQDSVCRKKAKQ